MSFNFQNFMTAIGELVPAVGRAVIALHPENPNEAVKIALGVELIQAATAILHQSTSPAPTQPAQPGVTTS